MEQIPKKYLKASNAVAALQKIRDWLRKGLRPVVAIRQLFEAYKTARTYGQKQYIGLLLSSFAEAIDSDLSENYANSFHLYNSLNSIRGGMDFFANTCKELSDLKWTKKFAKYLEEYKLYDHMVNDELFKALFVSDVRPHVLTIHQYDKIFVLGDGNAKSLDLVIADSFSEFLLFNTDTLESTNFTKDFDEDFLPSPVYKIVLVKHILEYLLSEIGFPYFIIKPKVVLFGSSKNKIPLLLNEYIFENKEEWKDIEFILADNSNKAPYFSSTSDLLVENEVDSEVLKELKQTLLLSLKATAIIYRKLLYSTPALPHTTSEFRKLAKYVFKDFIETETGIIKTAWIDNPLNIDCLDKAFLTGDKLSGIHDDGYPGYLLFYKDIKEDKEDDNTEEIFRRFKVNDSHQELTEISNIPEIYRSGIWNEKVIVIPGYVTSENDSDCVVSYMYIEAPHPVLPFVEKLLLPDNFNYFNIEDKKRIFPSLRQIIFYKPGYLKKEYSPAEIEEHRLIESIPEEMHRYTLEYLFRDWDPEDWPDGYYSADEPYDAVFSNMTFKYNSIPRTAELVSVPPSLTGRLIVPTTIPIPLNCVGSNQTSGNNKTIDVNTVIYVPVKKVSLDDKTHLDELVIPFDCDLSFSVEDNPNVKAIFFK